MSKSSPIWPASVSPPGQLAQAGRRPPELHSGRTCSGPRLDAGLFIYGEFLKLVAAREAGRGRLTICSCDRAESLTAQRHWRDGRDHLANAAIGTVVPYRDPSLNRSARGVASL